jgi:hypothetical protein
MEVFFESISVRKNPIGSTAALSFALSSALKADCAFATIAVSSSCGTVRPGGPDRRLFLRLRLMLS